MSEANNDPMPTIERLLRATNVHDVEAIVACFAESYTLDSPLHPARSFRGNEQVRHNWTQILEAVGDLSARLLGFVRDGCSAWTEWEIVGTKRDGTAHCMRGVFIFGVENGCIVSGRMFLEPVDISTCDANAGVSQVFTGSQNPGPPGRTP